MKSRLASPGCEGSACQPGARPASAAVTGCRRSSSTQVQQLGGRLLGQDVDRDPVVLSAAVDGVDLEVRRVRRALAAALDRRGDQDSVGVQGHDDKSAAPR